MKVKVSDYYKPRTGEAASVVVEVPESCGYRIGQFSGPRPIGEVACYLGFDPSPVFGQFAERREVVVEAVG